MTVTFHFVLSLNVHAILAECFFLFFRHGDRVFQVYVLYNGCPGDIAYTLVVMGNEHPCTFDQQSSYPQFLYANSTTKVYSETAGLLKKLKKKNSIKKKTFFSRKKFFFSSREGKLVFLQKLLSLVMVLRWTMNESGGLICSILS